MPNFKVVIREVWCQSIMIEADTPEEAKEKVEEEMELPEEEQTGQLIEDELEYSHTTDTEYWDVFPVVEQ